jgi:hypothetical protein
MNEVEREILIRIGENPDSPDAFSEGSEDLAMVRQSISDGIQELCMLTGSYRRTYLLALQDNCQFYRMAWGLDHVGYVVQMWDRGRKYRLTATDLIKLGTQDPNWMKRTGPPLEYFHVGWDTLGIFMRPSTGGTVLEVECVAIPRDYVDDQSPIKVRDAYLHAIKEFAVNEFYASRGDVKRAQLHFENYVGVVDPARMKTENTEQQFQMGRKQQ